MRNAKKVTSPAYEVLVEDLLTEFPDLEAGSLFGMPCLKPAGKAVVGSFDGGVVFKLAGAPDIHAGALALSGSCLFDPSEKGRPMKDWVVVTAEHEPRWGDFAAKAIGNGSDPGLSRAPGGWQPGRCAASIGGESVPGFA